MSNPPAWYPQVPSTSPAVSTALNFISITQHRSRAEGDGGSTIAAFRSPVPKAKIPPSQTQRNFIIAHSSSGFGGFRKHVNIHAIPLPQQKRSQATGYGRNQVTGPVRAMWHKSLPWPRMGKLRAEKPQGAGLEPVPTPDAPWHAPLCNPRGISGAVPLLTPRAAPGTQLVPPHPKPWHRKPQTRSWSQPQDKPPSRKKLVQVLPPFWTTVPQCQPAQPFGDVASVTPWGQHHGLQLRSSLAGTQLPQHKCGNKKSCPENHFAFKITSGAANVVGPSICFDDMV